MKRMAYPWKSRLVCVTTAEAKFKRLHRIRASDGDETTRRPQCNRLDCAARADFLHEPALLDRRADEGGKQRVRLEGAAFQLRVELHADEPGVVRVLDRLGQEPVRG